MKSGRENDYNKKEALTNNVRKKLPRSEMQRIERHRIAAIDAISQAYRTTRNKELKRLLQLVEKEVKKI